MRTSAFVATAAGIAASIAAFAQGPVYSVNIVGFQKVPAVNAFTQASNPFVQPSTDVNTVLEGQGDAGPNNSSADTVLLWNGSAYRTIFRSNDPNPAFNGKWLEFNDDTGELDVSTASLAPGVGFWIQNQVATNTFVIVGDVETAAQKSVTINPGFNMISYPYSTAVEFNTSGFNLDGSTGVIGDASGDKDKIFIWNGSAYLTFIYISGNADPLLNNKWCVFDDNTGELAAATYSIQPGDGFWYFRSGAAPLSWITNKPY